MAMYLCCLSVSGPVPTIPQLLKMNLPSRVGPKVNVFRTFLLNDDVSNKLANITERCRGDPEKIAFDVLREWLAGKGVEVSWDSLIATLRHCELPLMAEQIQMALSNAPSSSHFGYSQTSNLEISNMFGESSQPSYHQDPTASLWVRHPTDQRSFHHSVHSGPIAIGHGGHNQRLGPQSKYGGQSSPRRYHNDRHHWKRPPSCRDGLGRSVFYFRDNSAQRSGSRSQLSDTESWVKSARSKVILLCPPLLY